MMSFRRILIAVDSSPLAAEVAGVGRELASSLNAKIGFVSVTDTSVTDTVTDAVATDLPPSELIAIARDEAKQAVETLRSQHAGGEETLEFLPEGKPAEEIVKTAKDWAADMIVIGSHGEGGLARFLLGSVAEAVTRHAPCPVLLVRAHT